MECVKCADGGRKRSGICAAIPSWDRTCHNLESLTDERRDLAQQTSGRLTGLRLSPTLGPVMGCVSQARSECCLQENRLENKLLYTYYLRAWPPLGTPSSLRRLWPPLGLPSSLRQLAEKGAAEKWPSRPPRREWIRVHGYGDHCSNGCREPVAGYLCIL